MGKRSGQFPSSSSAPALRGGQKSEPLAFGDDDPHGGNVAVAIALAAILVAGLAGLIWLAGVL